MNNRQLFLIISVAIFTGLVVPASTSGMNKDTATIQETLQTIATYPFSDADPIPNPNKNYYPYFRYGGFSLESVQHHWKVVTLENEYLKVFVFPEVGGKIWGAIEKSTGREFIYYNSVVKFRDIAMRGPWTSGGIEFNFGIIGHVPTTSNPVDYTTRRNEDGSVSCIVGANELLTRSRWEVEIRLPKDKAWFSTTTTYHNATPLLQPYYQWHNGAFQAEGNLEYCFPGDVRLGHGGEARSWPIDEEGRDLSWYKNNAFGGSKSDMIMGSTKGFFAAYWHDYDFGSGHYADYGDKPGRKIFSWAQSRSGGIWEDLLTDDDGQYVEMQSGKSLNQAGANSMWTPFKHAGFKPWQTDVFTEYWFPVLATGGVSEANAFGALHVKQEGGNLHVYFCPLEKTNDEINIYLGDELHERFKVNLKPLETWKTTLSIENVSPLKIMIGDNKLVYRGKPEHLSRPVKLPEAFDWNSLYGLYTEGLNWMYQNEFGKANIKFNECLQKDSLYAPALNQMADIFYREGSYIEALTFARKSLALDTYDPKANFVYGLINRELGNLDDAVDGFSLATLSSFYRSAATIELAKLSLFRDDLLKASEYVQKLMELDPVNMEAIQLWAVINRLQGNVEIAKENLSLLEQLSPLNHLVRFEKMLLEDSQTFKNEFISSIKTELPNETFMEMAGWYESMGCIVEASRLLEMAPGNTMISFKLAYLYGVNNQSRKSEYNFNKAVASSPDFVFPFRKESVPTLEWAVAKSDNWQSKYLLGVLNWSLGHADKAKRLFEQCGDTPDVFYFYAAKPVLFGDETGFDAESDLRKALGLKPDEWRISKMLIDYYLDENDTKQALNIANQALKDFPANYEVRYTVGKCLLANEEYTECLEVLEGSHILPNEGASRGRVIYRQANLMKAIDSYKTKDWQSAMQFVEKARLWPENLGVGRPYNPDERLEDFLEAQCLLRMDGKDSGAQELFQKVVLYSENKTGSYTSSDYVYLLTLRRMGKESQIKEIITRWKKESPNDPVLKWSENMLEGNRSAAQSAASKINTGIEGGTPWNPKRTDPVFELVKSLGYAMKN